MYIVLATDHAGFELKQHISLWLTQQGHTVHDCGAFSFDADDDYPDYMHACANFYDSIEQNNANTTMIVFGGSGQGEAIAMNRHTGVRCIVYYGGNTEIVSLGRKHNDANCLSIGARFVDIEQTKLVVEIFMSTAFESGRHQRRVDAIDNIVPDITL